MQNSKVKRAVAWLLALLTIITSVPNISKYGLFADEESVTESTEIAESTEAKADSSTTENSTEVTSTELNTEVSTEIPTEPVKGSLYVKIGEGGDITLTANDLTTVIRSENGKVYAKENDGEEVDVTESLVDGFYLARTEEVGTVVSTNVTSKSGYKIESYSILSDSGDVLEEASVSVSSENTYSKEVDLSTINKYISVKISPVPTGSVESSTEKSIEEDKEVENSTESTEISSEVTKLEDSSESTTLEGSTEVSEEEEKNTGLVSLVENVTSLFSSNKIMPRDGGDTATVQKSNPDSSGTNRYTVTYPGNSARTGVCVSPNKRMPEGAYSYATHDGCGDPNCKYDKVIAAMVTCNCPDYGSFGSERQKFKVTGIDNAIALYSDEANLSFGFGQLHGYAGQLMTGTNSGFGVTYTYPENMDAKMSEWVKEHSEIMDSFSLNWTTPADDAGVQMIASVFYNPPYADVEIYKEVSGDSDLAKAVKNFEFNYSLEGLRLAIYKDEACTDMYEPEEGYFEDESNKYMDCFSNTNEYGCQTEDGFSEGYFGKFYHMRAGTYWVREEYDEAKSPMGYTISKDPVRVTVRRDTTKITIKNPPVLDPAGIEIKKEDLFGGDIPSNSSYDMKDAEYQVEYFDMVLNEDSFVEEIIDRDTGKVEQRPTDVELMDEWVTKTFKFKTKKASNGKYFARWDLSHKVSGDDTFIKAGKYPLGVYRVKETKAPKGYKKDPNTYIFSFTYNVKTNTKQWWLANIDEGTSRPGTNRLVSIQKVDDPKIISKEEPKGFDVQFRKVDAENYANGGSTEAQGAATFAGVTFRIVYDGNGKTYDKKEDEDKDQVFSKQRNRKVKRGEWIAEITAGDDGIVKTTGNALMQGYYHIEEVREGVDYLNDNTKHIEFNHTMLGDDWGDKVLELTDVMENHPKRGSVQLIKVDKETPDGAAQGDADLTGIRFAIKLRADVQQNSITDPYGTRFYPGQDVAVITTHKDAMGNVVAELPSASYLPRGYYSVRELPMDGTLANNSYHLTNGNEVYFNIDGTTPYNDYQRATIDGVQIKFEDYVVRGGVSVQKVDEDLNRNYAQGDATLEGAVFAIRYVSTTGQVVKVDGNFYRYGDIVKRITTNYDGYAETAADTLPYGTYEIYEETAPEGYLMSTNMDINHPKRFEVRKEGEFSRFNVDVKANPNHQFGWCLDPVKRGDVQIQKWDKELNKSEALGGKDHGANTTGTSLEGVRFVIKNVSNHNVWVNGDAGLKEYVPGEDVITITSHWNAAVGAYTAETVNRTLPYGTYTIREIGKRYPDNSERVNDSYLWTDKSESTFEIREDSVLVTNDKHTNLLHRDNQVVRGELEFIKKNGQSGRPMQVPFLITNISTGEQHMAITDKNGTFYSYKKKASSSDNTFLGVDHSENTNANDFLIEKYKNDPGYYATEEDMKNWGVGMWFSRGEDGSEAEVDDGLGALPYGQYLITELRCVNNTEVDMLSFTFSIDKNKVPVDLGTIDNNKVDYYEVFTYARDYRTGDNISKVEDTVKVTDTVRCVGLEVGEVYRLKGKFMNYDTEDEAMQAVNSEGLLRTIRCIPETVYFTANSPIMDVDLEYEFNGSEFADMTGVFYTYLYTGKGRPLADATEVDDKFERIQFMPELKTSLKDGYTGDEVATNGHVKLVDTVEYRNILLEREYEMNGKLINKATGEVVSEASTIFIPETEDGTVDVVFEFETDPEDGDYDLVAYEKLYIHGVDVTEHEDINDEGQTVHFPKIRTTAIEDNTGTHVGTVTDEVTTITDTVYYKNLVIGKEYTVSGSLMNQETGEPFEVDGKVVTASETFVADKKDGTIDLVFKVKTADLAGQTLVAFEDLEHNNVVVATHSDLEDEEQSIHYPEVKTTAIDGTSKDENGIIGDTTIIDTIACTNLIVGQEYTLTGTLMDKATGEYLGKDVGLQPIVETKTFVAEEKDQNVQVTFKVDTRLFEGKTSVVFEDLSVNGKVVRRHEDLTDKDQSVYFPKITTLAYDIDTGFNESLVNKDTTVVDTVKYSNLAEGREYTVVGKVIDSRTGEPLTKDGKEVSAERTFVAGVEEDTEEPKDDEDSGEEGVGTGEDTEDESSEDTETTEDVDTGEPPVIDGAVSPEGPAYLDKSDVEFTEEDDGSAYETVVYGEDEWFEVTEEGRVNGALNLEFNFDSTPLEGSSVVIYEYLYLDGVLVDPHTDIKDKNQTVTFPMVETTATDIDSSYHEQQGNETAVIIDRVDYNNLTVGRKYSVKGTLMDKETGEPLLINNELVTSSTTFVCEEPNGYVELRFELNSADLVGKDVVVFEKVYRNKKLIAVHTDIEDEGQTVDIIDIKTTALDEKTQTHEGQASKETVIVDTVAYWNLMVGKEYKMTGTLMNKVTGEPLVYEVNGVQQLVTGETVFIPTTRDGSVDVEFRFDSSLMAGIDVVAYEKLYHDGFKVAVHCDLYDKGQTVGVVDIGTTATSESNGTHEQQSVEGATILTDRVEYTGLQIGKGYKLVGTLINKATQEPIMVDGEPITVEEEFVPDARNGFVDMKFELDVSEYAGTDFVVYERLFRLKEDLNDVEDSTESVEDTETSEGPDEVLIATHEDPDDEGQTVDIIDIHTTATGKDSETHVAQAKEKCVIVDKVYYTNLVVGKKYTVTGTLMDKSTGKPLKVNGKKVIAKKTFIPETRDGYVELKFKFDASALAGTTVVAFEDLKRDDILIATHSDIEDEEQTVDIVDIHTTALSKTTKAHEVQIGSETVITDKVKYEGLTPGKKYTMKGTLMVKETGKALKVNGKKVTAKKTFKPKKPNGSVTLEFKFDSSALAGKTIVVFEDLIQGEFTIATHSDIDDEKQSVHMLNIGTTATDQQTGSHEMTLGDSVVLVDTVAYTGLIPDKEYTLQGTVIDKNDGSVIATASTTFKPEMSDGSTIVSFNINTNSVAGRALVVFEELYNKKGTLVAKHKDLNDEGQTVTVPNLPELKRTADDMYWAFLLGLFLLILGGCAVYFSILRKKFEE